ncbi:PstS family phosphate ABC transporter substrate-binding protein [Halomonas huangheensis]|uniref:PBP domain-containing protein n=1 Tax=Halomonas huangheensis TaxID=1178482 RepID=W1N5Z7_9GAMM|nr:phosphate ABC transporter substrate-binding protein [Halomonas huangheensis]ERL50948.1 hypothetical protein BJB45_20350 [Halomonas huangheensis]
MQLLRNLQITGNIVCLLLLCCLGLTPGWAQADDVVGNLDTVGSDTMAELMLRWGELLRQDHPGLRVQMQASGSASAPTALTAGTTLIGPMSRPMLDNERSSFAERHGYQPTRVAVGRDALVIVVNRHNPLQQLTAQQLDAIFSDTRRCGAEAEVTHWSQLGLDSPSGRIHVHGRNAVSGTHELFRRAALCDGNFRVTVNASPGSAAVVAAVGSDPGAIGYAGLNHLTADVHTVAIGPRGEAVSPNHQTLHSGAYPMARELLLYVNRPPDAALPAPERALLDLILSPRGQQVVTELGFVALPIPELETQRQRLGLPAFGDLDVLSGT